MDGFAELKSDLRRLSFANQQLALTRAARAGAKIVKARIEERAPRDTGKLAESIIITQAGQKNDLNRVAFEIGPSTKAFYGLFLEYGTAFISSEPFVGPSFEDVEDQVMNAIASQLRTEIDRLG